MDPFATPCTDCKYPHLVTPPCPYGNRVSPKVVLVFQAPGSGALCSRHVCRYNWHLKANDLTALTMDWVFSSLGIADEDVMLVNALRCANQDGCFHRYRTAENTVRSGTEYARCSWALRSVLSGSSRKVVLLLGAQAHGVFCRAFRNHPGIQTIKSLGWESSARMDALHVGLLSHPGQLGLNQRRRRAGPDCTNVLETFRDDVEHTVTAVFPAFTLRRDAVSRAEFRSSPVHPHPSCSCRDHPGMRLPGSRR